MKWQFISKSGLAFAVLAAIAVLVASPAPRAMAQSAACTALQSRLNAPQQHAGTSAAYREWDRKAAGQRAALARTERQALAGRCREGSGRRHDQCGQILSTIKRMRANLAKLERRRDRYAGRTSAGPSQASIRTRMQELDCGGTQRAARTRAAEHRAGTGLLAANAGSAVRVVPPESAPAIIKAGFLERIFGPPRDSSRKPRSRVRFRGRESVTLPRVYNQPDRRNDGLDLYDPFSGSSFGGTYRTICVRRCDGYYFPISFSTTDAMFGRDADICSRMCPAGDPELFVHANPGGTPETMTALDGRAYAELPTAFKYRRSFDKACSCQSASKGRLTTLSTSAGRPGFRDIGARASEPVVHGAVLPIAKRPPGLDPDTRINLLADYRPVTAGQSPLKVTGNSHTIRVVGPKYFIGGAARPN